MMERILKNYEHPDKKKLFKENETIYDTYLKTTFENYNQKDTESQYFAHLFEGIKEISITHSKQYSNLKHMCYELSELLLKTGKTLHKISNAYDKVVKTSHEFNRKIQFKGDERINSIDKKLKGGIAEWGSQLISQRKFVVDNMASFFHFRKHEYLAFETLIESKIAVDTLYKKKFQDLEKKKIKLFESKKIDNWKLSMESIKGDFNEIFKNYAKIKPYIIPDVNLLGDKGGNGPWRSKRLPEQTSSF
jgi:hypothetical protein